MKVWKLSQPSSLESYLPFCPLVILVDHIVTRGCKEPQDKAKMKMVKYFSWLLAVCSQITRGQTWPVCTVSYRVTETATPR